MNRGLAMKNQKGYTVVELLMIVCFFVGIGILCTAGRRLALH